MHDFWFPWRNHTNGPQSKYLPVAKREILCPEWLKLWHKKTFGKNYHQNLYHSQIDLSKVAVWEAVPCRIILLLPWLPNKFQKLTVNGCFTFFFDRYWTLLLSWNKKIQDSVSVREDSWVFVHIPSTFSRENYPEDVLDDPLSKINHGPLVYLSSLRFEAKHQYFKRVATVLENFKNITKSLARRH